MLHRIHGAVEQHLVRLFRVNVGDGILVLVLFFLMPPMLFLAAGRRDSHAAVLGVCALGRGPVIDLGA
jgi:hypothetical protein